MRHLSTALEIFRLRGVHGAAAAIAFGIAAVAGCTAEVETAHPVVVDTDTEATVEVQTVPADIYAYPRAQYRGRNVYWVNGYWYYPNGSHWYYYRAEPPELVRHRRYIETAPPARPAYPPPDEAVRVR
jgi:hypothetical protein